MSRIGTPLKLPESNLQPEPEGGIELSENMQQVLSILTGFVENRRVLLKASPGGILRTTSPRVIDIKHLEGSGQNDQVQGSNIPCSEVMCMGDPTNTGTIWVRSLKTATTMNAWPLAAKDVINLSVDNFRDVRALIITHADMLICAIA